MEFDPLRYLSLGFARSEEDTTPDEDVSVEVEVINAEVTD